jgi:hypothetical protein
MWRLVLVRALHLVEWELLKRPGGSMKASEGEQIKGDQVHASACQGNQGAGACCMIELLDAKTSKGASGD